MKKIAISFILAATLLATLPTKPASAADPVAIIGIVSAAVLVVGPITLAAITRNPCYLPWEYNSPVCAQKNITINPVGTTAPPKQAKKPKTTNVANR